MWLEKTPAQWHWPTVKHIDSKTNNFSGNFMAINFDKALGVHEQALMLRQRRHEVLATNIANADTPGFKARDIDFRGAMSQVGNQSNLQNMTLRTTQAGHQQALEGSDDIGEPQLLYRLPTQSSVDGNTVESHTEQAAFADNSLRYQTTLQFLGGRFSSLKSVLQGGR